MNTITMNNQKPSSEEIARRKFNKATSLLGEVCVLAGKDSVTVRVHRIDQGQPVASIVLAPSHIPTRYPERPLPIPPQSSPCYLDPVAFERERREIVAKKWSERTGHDPALHHAGHFATEWKIVHHPECVSQSPCSKFGACDCGPLFLVRIAGQVFAVMADARLERFMTPPPKPTDFRADKAGFFWDQSFGISDTSTWLIPLLAETLEFSTYGSGGHEHFLELPHESDIETGSVQ